VRKYEGKRLLQRLHIVGRVTLKCVFSKYDGGVDLVDVAQDKVRWPTAVKTEPKIRFP